MSFDLKVTGIEKLDAASQGYRRARAFIRARTFTELNDFGNRSIATIRKDFLTGPRPAKLGVRTGRLRSSIRFRTIAAGDQMAVVFGTDVPYAAIHEFGGKTSPHVIRPRRKPFLAFMKGGEWIYTRKAIQHPGSSIPRRPFLKPGAEAGIPRLRDRLMAMLRDAGSRKFGGQQ